ncbi:MAG: hypothetical protein QOD56_526, partial [Gammaproteobacteria bacterium]|nr:hypothetical protein [Gammaproteobacteria bacterium]
MRIGIRLRACWGAALSIACAASLHAQVSVTTFHNDNARTGQNLQETILTPANVNSSQFGKLFSVGVDGAVYAQPLYLPNVRVGGGTHNVVYVATEHDSVYAVDADTGSIYWHLSLVPAGGSTVSSGADLNCGDVTTEVGITGTPVIDAASDTLYVVAKVKVNGAIYQYLHALDVSTAAEKFGGPVNIQASVPGTATDGDGSTLTFNSRMENQRGALLLENGHVIVTWASHCDLTPWHGWIMSYGAGTLSQEAAYSPSANGYGNGIWMGAGGPAADAGGNIFVATGNGTWTGTDLGDSIVKLGPPSNMSLPVLDYFTPYNQAGLSGGDRDLSSGGVVLLPTLASGKQLLTVMGKEGRIYLIDRNNLGKYCATQASGCGGNRDPQIVQEITGAFTAVWGTPAYWNGNLYWAGGNDDTIGAEPLKAYAFNAGNSGLISRTPTSVSAQAFHFSTVPAVSANGNTNAILWALDDGAYQSTCSAGKNCQVLWAYDATTLTKMLYNSGQAAGNRDVPGSATKFASPTIANGKVYISSRGAISAFGLLSSAPGTASTPTFSLAASTYTSAQSLSISDTTPGAVIYYTTDGTPPTTASARYASGLKISATTTVQAFAAATGYASSGVASATYVISASGGNSVTVNLAGSYTVYGAVADGSPVANGGLDTSGDAVSATLLGSTVAWAGTTFPIGSTGPNAVSGVTLTLPTGNYSTLNLLGTAVHGNQANQSFVVTYTDGTASTIKQSLSDWFTPQNYPGESKAATMAYRLTSSGAKQTGPFYLYGYALAINSAKTVKSVTLPGNRDVVVFSATLSGATTTPVPPPPTSQATVSLTAVANVYGIANNGAGVAGGGMDTYGSAYSASLIGTSVTWSGASFALGAAGVADAVSAKTIPLPAGRYGALKLLATAVHATQVNQKFVVSYTDGTSTTVQQSLSDWFMPQGYAGESTVLDMAYRVGSNGATQTGPYHLYGYSLTLDAAKTVTSLTLPSNRYVVVLAATLVPAGASSAPPSSASTVSLTAAANVYAV